jgi:hypothetical protein
MTSIPSNPKPKRGANLTGTKIFVASCGMAMTIGIWGVIANNGLLENQNTGQATETPVVESDQNSMVALPTLIPLRSHVQASNIATNSNASSPGSLRVVAAQPTSAAVVQKPVVQEIVVGASTGGGGGGSSSRAPAAKTKSSK